MSVFIYILCGNAAMTILLVAALRWPERWPPQTNGAVWAFAALLWPILVPAILISMATTKTTKHH